MLCHIASWLHYTVPVCAFMSLNLIASLYIVIATGIKWVVKKKAILYEYFKDSLRVYFDTVITSFNQALVQVAS